jgi:hypothetical protein
VTGATVALALSGIAIGLSQACQDDPSRDEQIRNYRRTITASDRHGNYARTQIAILTQTPDN